MRNLAYNDPVRTIESVDQYLSNGFPLQGVSLREETMGGDYNFKFAPMVKDLKAKYGDKFNMIFPFTAVVPNDSVDQLPTNVTVVGPDGKPFGVSLDSASGVCMDGFNTDLTNSYLVPLFNNYNDTLTPATSAFWLDRNEPYLTGNNLTAANPFTQLPFYPGNKDPSANSLPDQAVHNVNGATEISNFYIRSRFGFTLAT